MQPSQAITRPALRYRGGDRIAGGAARRAERLRAEALERAQLEVVGLEPEGQRPQAEQMRMDEHGADHA